MELHSLVFRALADASIRSLVLALAALAAIWLVRARSAPLRHAVWTAVVCAMLSLPLLSVVLPSIPLRILPAAPEIALSPAPIELSGQAPFQAAPALAPPRPQRDWTSIAFPAWLLVTVAFLGRLLFGYAASRRLVRASTPIRDPLVTAALERLGATPAPALAESDSVSVPLTLGWIEPYILLPAGWRAWDRTKLEAVLAHELAHVRRSDWLVAMLAGVNRGLFWFHPLAWWMKSRLTTLAEEACDESSVAATGDPKRYAEVLLEMAVAVRASNGRLTSHAVAMARRSQVRRRIETILDETHRLSRGMTKARWAAVLLCGVPLIYGAAALQVQPATRPATVKAQNPRGPWPEGGYLDTAAQGKKLNAGEARSLEGYLAANPEDLPARGRLIAYYYENGVREPRLKHIFWLIERHPESEIAGFNSAGIFATGGTLNDASDYARAKQMWLEQTQRRANEPRVLGNAVIFFSQAGGDLATAEDLLKRLRRLEPRNMEWINRLSSLYVSTIRAAGNPRLAASSDPGLAERFKSELEASTDGIVVASVGSSLGGLSRGQDAGPTAEFGRRLMQRAEELGVGKVGGVVGGVPGGSAGGVVGGVPGGSAGGVVGGVPGGVSSSNPNPIRRVPPVYPPLARQARVTGTVRVEATVGVDGQVRSAVAISGPPLLRRAAVEAVRQWVYEPGRRNGVPVEVTTQVDVGFTLPPLPPLPLTIGRFGGQLGVHWNGEAEVLRDAQRATLTIIDGDHPEEVPLGPAQLRSGSFVYAPITGAVLFRLEVFSPEGKIIAASESRASTPGVEGSVPGGTPNPAPPAPVRIRVGGNVQARNILYQVDPVYPPLARQARIQGTVRFTAIIATDGHVQNLQLVSGHPLLVPAAQEAVRQWGYRPTLLNGDPVEVVTQIDVNFVLPERE